MPNFQLALDCFNDNNLQEAVLILEEGIKAGVNHADTFHLLGVIKAIQDKSEEAKLYLQQSINLDPKNPEYHFNFANLMFKNGEVENAIDYYSMAIVLDLKYYSAYLDRGIAYKKIGKYRNAIADFGKAIAIDGCGVEPYIYRAKLYLLQNDIQNAFNDLNFVLKIDPNQPEANNWIAWIYGLGKEYRKAYEIYQNLEKKYPDFLEAKINMSKLCMRMGRHSEGLKIMRLVSGSISFDLLNGPKFN